MIAVLVTASDVSSSRRIKDDFLLEMKTSCLNGSSLLSCPGYYVFSSITRFLHKPHSPIQVSILINNTRLKYQTIWYLYVTFLFVALIHTFEGGVLTSKVLDITKQFIL